MNSKEATKYFETEFDLSRKRLQMAADLQAVKDSAGAAALEKLMTGDAISPIARRIGDSQEQLSLMDAAIRVSRQKRVEAVHKEYAAEAEALRKQARAKRAEADRRQARTDKLLEALEEFEGVTYAPASPNPPTPALVEGRVTGLGADTVIRKVSQTAWLQLEAQDLEMSARGREAQRVRNGGTVSGDSIEELVSAIEDLGVEVLGPPIVNVAEWIGSGVAQDAERKRAHYRTTGAPGADGVIVFEVSFKDGKIDHTNSNARLVEREKVPA